MKPAARLALAGLLAGTARAQPACPAALTDSTVIDDSATLYYAMVPSDPADAGNGLFCGRLEVENDGWAGVAFSSSGGMADSTGVIGVDGAVSKYDLFQYGVTEAPAERQTLMDASIVQDGDMTVMTFAKLLEEEGDVAIVEGSNTMLHARGGDSISYHGGVDRFVFSVELSAATTLPETESPTSSSPVTQSPTVKPSLSPVTDAPTAKPSLSPVTEAPTMKPTLAPVTDAPTTGAPTTASPTTASPTTKPVAATEAPTTASPSPGGTTAAPVTETTEAPTTPAPSAGGTTAAPVESTASPVDATAPPVTASPVSAAPTPAPFDFAIDAPPTVAPTTKGPTPMYVPEFTAEPTAWWQKGEVEGAPTPSAGSVKSAVAGAVASFVAVASLMMG